MDLDEFYKQPLVLKVVRAMAQREPEPFTMRQFTEASGYTSRAARKLRDAMEEWNLIVVEGGELSGMSQQIRLTPYGREINDVGQDLAKILERAARAKARESTREA